MVNEWMDKQMLQLGRVGPCVKDLIPDSDVTGAWWNLRVGTEWEVFQLGATCPWRNTDTIASFFISFTSDCEMWPLLCYTFPLSTMMCCLVEGSEQKAHWPWTDTSKIMSPNSLSHFKIYYLGYFIIVTKSWLVQWAPTLSLPFLFI